MRGSIQRTRMLANSLTPLFVIGSVLLSQTTAFTSPARIGQFGGRSVASSFGRREVFSSPRRNLFSRRKHSATEKNDILLNETRLRNHRSEDSALEPSHEGVPPPFKVTLESEDGDYDYKDAVIRTLGWVGAAIIFGGAVWAFTGSETGEEFFAGYLVEQSLSVDNLFVFLLLFEYFKVPLEYQDRVLNWGIYGAVIMRGIMIGLGAAALQNFHAILLVFAAILVYSSANFFIGAGGEEEEDPSENSIVKFSNNLIKSTDLFDGDKFFTIVDGVRKATPLFICMIAVEISDVVFAVDSIPAVFGVTEVSIDRYCTFYTLGGTSYLTVSRLATESFGCLFIQSLCYYGTTKSVHNLIESSYGSQVLGACGGSCSRLYWQ